MDHAQSYLQQSIIPNDIPFLAVPTTAGTGSEATRYAVIYYNGEKQSICDDSCIPTAVLMESSLLKTLPEYQRKSTMLDALCHAIESYWSVNSTAESKKYSKEAIQLILTYMKAYLDNTEIGNKQMMIAANLAGKAINITQTTAGHAMCYKLTSLYGIAHGYAAALCIEKLWDYMINHIEKCRDFRGKEYLQATFLELAYIMNCSTPQESVEFFKQLLKELNLEVPTVKKHSDYEILSTSVNITRLNNNPVALDSEIIKQLYEQILERK